MVIVEIGPNRMKHYVHKALLQYHSEYFRNALRGPWKEAMDGVVSLEDVQPAVFSLFVHWLYSQSFPTSDSEWKEVLQIPDNVALNNIRFARCIESYIFGGCFLAPGFCRAASSAFAAMRHRTEFWTASCLAIVKLAFSSLPPSCIVLQLMVDDYRRCWAHRYRSAVAFTPDGQSRLPRALLGRVMRSYHQMSEGDSNEEHGLILSRCYVEHQDDTEKEGCSKEHMVYNEEEGCGYFH
ncbi:hypothetical protein BKA63DRAFT_498491 [Paraphoma chrysanthemicola]|nr:hypothetical protein BKA63DRAFT_498491 [Paraphoma chrysanthemicola]